MEKRYKKYRNYLEIVYEILKEDALEAKKERDKYKVYGENNSDFLFQSGLASGYDEIMSILKNNAASFNIDLKKIELHEDDIMEKYKKYKDYLETVCEILKKKALEAKKVSKKYRLLGEEENPRSLFHSGRSLAYYGVVDTLYDYAIILEIDLKKIKLDDINPDTDLG